MERHEGLSCSVEEVSAQLRQLLARLSKAAVFHLGDTIRVVHRVAAGWRDLIDAPDGVVVVTIAGDDLRRAQGAVRLTRHEQTRDRRRHRQLAFPSRRRPNVGDRADTNRGGPIQHPDRFDHRDPNRIVRPHAAVNKFDRVVREVRLEKCWRGGGRHRGARL